MTSSTHDSAWVEVSACTLPTAEQPIRVAEFDDLFASSVRGVERVDSTTIRLLLDRTAEERARDLAERESSCCSFFAFDIAAVPGAEVVAMRVSVPAAHQAVVNAFAERASNAAGLR